ncbi:Conserved_hypothetical protein [Hexamita inflata]|uniref:Uncharacterized protein n=1 Tax=Hexamita inflata TaxID=28002 RepID=A0ABP1JE16_9EUKA
MEKPKTAGKKQLGKIELRDQAQVAGKPMVPCCRGHSCRWQKNAIFSRLSLFEPTPPMQDSSEENWFPWALRWNATRRADSTDFDCIVCPGPQPGPSNWEEQSDQWSTRVYKYISMVFIRYKQFGNHPGLLGSFPPGLGPQFSASAAKRVKQIYLTIQLIHKYIVKHVRRSYEYIHSDSETIHGLALSLESIDDVLGSNSLTLSVISVDERVTDDNVEESLQDFTSLWIDGGADTLDTSSTSETTDSWLGDTSEDVLFLRSVLSFTEAFTLTFT